MCAQKALGRSPNVAFLAAGKVALLKLEISVADFQPGIGSDLLRTAQDIVGKGIVV